MELVIKKERGRHEKMSNSRAAVYDRRRVRTQRERTAVIDRRYSQTR